MRPLVFAAVATIFVLPHTIAAQTTAAETAVSCAPDGSIQPICGQSAAEDLLYIPGTDWVVAASRRGKTEGIRLISMRDKTITTIYPSTGATDRFDKKTYDTCPGPLDAEDKAHLVTHGLALRAGDGGMYELYVIQHGERESIEVFDLDARGKPPSITWIGCVVAPDPISLNSVVGLPDGGLIATNFVERGAGRSAASTRMRGGEKNGEVWEWHTGKGWTKVLGSEASGANGVEISKDGKWLYVAEWGSQSFFRLSRGDTPPQRDTVTLGFRVDNVHWAPDGMLLAAGQTEKGSKVVKIDPNTLKVTELVDQLNTSAIGPASVAIQIGNEMWVGSYIANGIAIVPASK